MFGLGPAEMVIILALVLIIFGAGKLPDVFGSLGKGIKEFRDASEGENKTIVKSETTTVTPSTVETVSSNHSVAPRA